MSPGIDEGCASTGYFSHGHISNEYRTVVCKLGVFRVTCHQNVAQNAPILHTNLHFFLYYTNICRCNAVAQNKQQNVIVDNAYVNKLI